MQECKDSLRKIGRRPWSNRPSVDECRHCGEPWVYQRSQQDVKLAGAQEALRIKLAEKAKLASSADAGGVQLSKTQLKKQRAATAKADAAQAQAEAEAAAEGGALGGRDPRSDLGSTCQV